MNSFLANFFLALFSVFWSPGEDQLDGDRNLLLPAVASERVPRPLDPRVQPLLPQRGPPPPGGLQPLPARLHALPEQLAEPDWWLGGRCSHSSRLGHTVAGIVGNRLQFPVCHYLAR
jgi:hypothetical protein